MKRLQILLFLLSITLSTLFGAKIDTILIYSPSMNKQVKNVVITPIGTTKNATYPTLYLLHGYSGNHQDWIRIKPNLGDLADQYGLIIVCPDAKNSWYWDSPIDTSYRYETYMTTELVPKIDATYQTIKQSKKRAITGLSMGGQGALWLAFRHPAIFGACGSMSGGLDIRSFPTNWEISKRLGSFSTHQSNWEKHAVINQIEKLKGTLAIIIDCGVADFFLEVNNNFHQKLLNHKIDHDYIVRPGTHNGAYWENAIEYQLLFFNRFFTKPQTTK